MTIKIHFPQILVDLTARRFSELEDQEFREDPRVFDLRQSAGNALLTFVFPPTPSQTVSMAEPYLLLTID